MSKEVLKKFDNPSDYVPMKGWALFDRSVPTRLNPEAREYLVEIFEAGKVNRNHRVSPEEAEMKLKNRFPLKEDSWLTVKQVVICLISNIKKTVFSPFRSRVCSVVWQLQRD
jgi:hypothetical protein